VDAALGPDDYERLYRETRDLAFRAYRVMNDDPILSPVAIVVARSIVSATRMTIKAMCLREKDFEDRVVVVAAETGDPEFDSLRNSPWDRILGSTAAKAVISIGKTSLPFDFAQDRAHPGFWERLRCTGWPRLGYRIWLRFWGRWGWTPPRGTLLILRENALLRETAYHLANQGHAVRSLPQLQPRATSADHDLCPVIRSALAPLVTDYVASLTSESVRSGLKEFLLRRVEEDVNTYEASKLQWRKILENYRTRNVKAILTNAPNRPLDVALLHECRRLGILFLSFQHGVSKEIDAQRDALDCATEATTSDVFFAFNHRCCEVMDAIPYNTGDVVSVGLPFEYWHGGKKRKPKCQRPAVAYISTQLFVENSNVPLYKWATDHDVADAEISLINNVLDRIPHRVFYKPYPEHRYLDADPVVECARSASNLEFHDGGLDLSYLFPDLRVIVTARATSTLGWCLLSNKPLVFLDLKYQSPLRVEVKNALQKALFLFDDSSDSFYTDLQEFLSQPIETIEAMWRAKEKSRSEAIERYFGSDGPGAGKRAAQHVIRMLGDNRRTTQAAYTNPPAHDHHGERVQ